MVRFFTTTMPVSAGKREYVGKRAFAKRSTSYAARGSASRASKTSAKRGGRRAAIRGFGGSDGPFGDSLSVPFSYSSAVSLSATTGSYANHQFRANSLFDPDVTGAGAQPRWFDTLCGAAGGTAPFQSYLVNGCVATAEVRSRATTHLYAALTMMRNSSASPVDLQEAKERADTIVEILPPLGSGPAVTTLNMYRSMKSILNIKDMKDYGGARANYNANPTSQVLVVLTLFNPDSAGTEQAKVELSMKYYSQLFTLNNAADS